MVKRQKRRKSSRIVNSFYFFLLSSLIPLNGAVLLSTQLNYNTALLPFVNFLPFYRKYNSLIILWIFVIHYIHHHILPLNHFPDYTLNMVENYVECVIDFSIFHQDIELDYLPKPQTQQRPTRRKSTSWPMRLCLWTSTSGRTTILTSTRSARP